MNNFVFESFAEIDNKNTVSKELIFGKFSSKLNKALYEWHESIVQEIKVNKYLNPLNEINIKLTTYRNLVVSLMTMSEVICEASRILYVKNSEASYSVFDLYKIIDKLVNLKQTLDKKTIMLFSIMLFKELRIDQKIEVKINDITNQFHPIIIMVFCNEMQKQIKDLGLKMRKGRFVIDNIDEVSKRDVKEEFIRV